MLATYEVCHNLENPVRLDEYDGAYVESAAVFAQERLVLHPCYYIVKTPARIQEYCCG